MFIVCSVLTPTFQDNKKAARSQLDRFKRSSIRLPYSSHQEPMPHMHQLLVFRCRLLLLAVTAWI